MRGAKNNMTGTIVIPRDPKEAKKTLDRMGLGNLAPFTALTCRIGGRRREVCFVRWTSGNLLVRWWTKHRRRKRETLYERNISPLDVVTVWPNFKKSRLCWGGVDIVIDPYHGKPS